MTPELVLQIGLIAWPIAIVVLIAALVISAFVFRRWLRERRALQRSMLGLPDAPLVPIEDVPPVRIEMRVWPEQRAISPSAQSDTPLNISKVARRRS